MVVVVDTSAVLAVLLHEPSRSAILKATDGVELFAPFSLPWELGNALSSMFKQRRLDLVAARLALNQFQQVPIQFEEVDLLAAIEIASVQSLYAYDAYMIACAMKRNAPLLTLDRSLAAAAERGGVELFKVA